ncbi:hypothetical protein HWV62_37813 [Athelia sp. TMB]|nr:hypothetical protein HWV62_37813 [Athelia sp. TMB]
MSFAVVHAASLFLTFVFTLVGGALGVSAIVKAQNKWSKLGASVPTGAFIFVNVTDLLTPGAIVTVACFLLCVNALVFLLFLAIPVCRRVDMSARTLLFQALTLLTFGLALFGALVPYTLFLAKREAEVTAFLGLSQIPTIVVTGLEDAVGWTGVYRDVPYLRILAIIPWFAFLFTMITAVLSFVGLRRYHAEQAAAVIKGKEKELPTTPETRERVAEAA